MVERYSTLPEVVPADHPQVVAPSDLESPPLSDLPEAVNGQAVTTPAKVEMEAAARPTIPNTGGSRLEENGGVAEPEKVLPWRRSRRKLLVVAAVVGFVVVGGAIGGGVGGSRAAATAADATGAELSQA